MIKDQEIKKLESESTMAEGTTESYVTISQDEDKRIVVHSHIPMSFPSTANTSWFDSRDAILFIERFYQICKNHGTTKKIIGKYSSKRLFMNFVIKTLLTRFTIGITSRQLQRNHMLGMATFISIFENTLLLPVQFKKIVWVTMDLINQYKGNKKIFKEDEIKQKKIEKLIEALKKTASFAKTKESELKVKAKGSDSTNIEAAIEKMTNKFTNLALVMRVQSNQIQEKLNQYYILQREEPPKSILNYPTNVTVNPTTVQENTQLPVNLYLA
ncbi:uncharacterized protein CIMG_13245 [Coccidioides immitis RS]|uniref:Uncharacterized protein n=1 Tax=Coccidioides immitis (strain RS) TaxID=246410 RepID=A0A0E1RW09_COCIM|nr:uncharacterized protein CIMG_13245 [Coccidioides immitis RS]EAS29528.2 hypothetical protein CIMG_13245 [Coccidioides immitis RS]